MPTFENPIAIVGMGCHFPGASNLEEYWDLLRLGKNAIRHFSHDELDLSGVTDPLLAQDERYVKARGILDHFVPFHSADYSFLESELPNIDFQARVFLPLVVQALKDAGIDPKSCPKETGVFTGANAGVLAGQHFNAAHTMQAILEVAYSRSLSSIVAYQFDLRANAVSVHTGCSTSLIAVIQACEALQLHAADLAIAGGISVAYPEHIGYLYEEKGPLSPNGQCRPFDAEANGTVLSNGAGVVILKRLEDAMTAGDHIYAVIRGKAANNDGRMKTGFLAASIQGQHACLRQAWKDANIGIEQLDYIEAHGSATLIGDPIELFALKKMLNGQSYAQKTCGIGSVKSNIGHTTVASGMAAIIKAALMLRNRALVPTINFQVLNKNIDLTATPYYIATENVDLTTQQKTMCIGVSNFGFGGSNAHIVMDNAR